MSTEINNSNDQPQETQKVDAREYNFAQIRKQLEAERQEKRDLAERLAELERKMSPKDEDEEVDEDPYIDGRKLKKTVNKIKEELRKEFSQVSQAQTSQALEKERQNTFMRQNSDFFEVLSEENVQKFAANHPDIAENMLEMPDNFARRKLLYQNIKAFDLQKRTQEQSIQEKIDANKRNPLNLSGGMPSSPYDSIQGDFSPSGQKQAYEKVQELKARLRLS